MNQKLLMFIYMKLAIEEFWVYGSCVKPMASSENTMFNEIKFILCIIQNNTNVFTENQTKAVSQISHMLVKFG